jgi:hypothetical protein
MSPTPPLPRPNEIRTWPPFESSLVLLEYGFTPLEAVLLVAMRQRYARGESVRLGVPTEHNRLLFVRWLIDHGRLSDDLPAA